MPGVTRIGPKRPHRIYLAEWREERSLTQKQLAERIGVTDMTVSRWETGAAQLNLNVLAAISEALNIQPADIYRHPDQPSADALLRDATPAVRDAALARIIEMTRRRG